MRKTTELTYRIAAVDSASPIGLLLALYDTLAGDLLRASQAIRAGNIEQRCFELNHAFAVLGQLENWLDPDRRDPLTQSLAQFYGYLRAKALEASIQQSAATLDAAIELVLQVRATWQQRASLVSQQESAAAVPHDPVVGPRVPHRVALSQSA